MDYRINFTRKTVHGSPVKDAKIGNTETESIELALEDIKCSWDIEYTNITGLYKVVTTNKGSKECPRCKGTGKLEQHLNYHNGICFQCDGLGKVEDIEIKKTRLNLKKYIENIDKVVE